MGSAASVRLRDLAPKHVRDAWAPMAAPETPPLVFSTPSRSCGARIYNGSLVWITARRYRRKVRRLGGRYANVLMVYSPEHDAHWWAIEDELFYDREECA